MNDLYMKYFAGVRWVELALAFGVAVLSDLQLTVASGVPLNQPVVVKALAHGASVAWAYLREPKTPDPEAAIPAQQLTEGAPTVPDVAGEIVHAVVVKALGPMAAVPDLAENIVKELARMPHWRIRL